MSDQNPRPGFRAEQLVSALARDPRVTDDHVTTLRETIASSPTLAGQISIAFSSGCLRQFGVLEPSRHALGEYCADRALIRLSLNLLSDPGPSTFVLGHEVQHARNARVAHRAVTRLHAAVGRAAATDCDYTQPIEDFIRASRTDESTANLAGWNALVSRVRGYRRRPQLKDVLSAAPYQSADFVIGRGSRTRFFPSLSADGDLSIPMTEANIEAMARKYFDKVAEGTRLGPRGTSDYRNYYAAWALSLISKVHSKISTRQPLRVDLVRLGLSRKLIEESGIDLHGLEQLICSAGLSRGRVRRRRDGFSAAPRLS